MGDLIPVHGGLSAPVNRMVPADEVPDFRKRAGSLRKVRIPDADMSSVYRFGDGGLSPLTGPMDGEAYRRVLDESRIEIGGNAYAWTIPIALPVDAATASALKPGEEVALARMDGEVVATLKLTDIFNWDKAHYLKQVYLTDRTDHPGGDMVLNANAQMTHLLGGSVRALPQPKQPGYGRHMMTPVETRRLFARKGWDRVVGFQTRNPLHRAHEYALVYGLERLLKQGYNAGAALNPLVGETKADDVSAEVRMRTYEALIESRGLGEGDSDPELWKGLGETVPDRVVLIGLDIKMFYGGPKEAVMHSIYRQNYGFTDLVIGRKHADAPYHDGSAIWGDFDAQEIFDNLAGDLKIKPVKVGFAAYYESVGRVDLMENHGDERPVFISGKAIREMLQKGEPIDSRVMRETTARILSEAMKS